LQEKRVFEDPLNGFDEVGLQSGRVLLFGVPGVKELVELGVLLWTQNLLGSRVTGAEGRVELEVVGVEKEGAGDGE